MGQVYRWQKSQSSSVYSINGICFTLMACTHGYAMGYIVVEVEDVKDTDFYDEKGIQVKHSSNVS